MRPPKTYSHPSPTIPPQSDYPQIYPHHTALSNPDTSDPFNPPLTNTLTKVLTHPPFSNIMTLTYRILHFLFLRHANKHTPQEAALFEKHEHLATLRAQHTAHIRAALETLIRELRGESAAVWTCHACKTRNDVLILRDEVENPLGVLKCMWCEHVCCLECAHEGGVERWATEGRREKVKVSSLKDKCDKGSGKAKVKELLPCVSICAGCGLSWRAKMLGLRKARWGFARRQCVCGCRPSKKEPWIGFKLHDEEVLGGRTRGLLKRLKKELDKT